jgi:glycosyltransferase involved in cell wall biosynthesis
LAITPHSVSAFFPLYNDAPSVELMVERARSTLDQVTDDWEIILVEDCSPDNAGELADRLAAADKRIRVIHHRRNLGYGGALRSGFAAATKDLIFYTDGDAQYDPREMPLLLRHMDHADVVNGYKIQRGDRLIRRVLGRVYHTAVKLLFGLPMRDVDCDFRLMRREVMDSIELESDSGVICAEMMTKIYGSGFRVIEAPVHHYPRLAGESQFFRFGRIVRTLRGLMEQWVKLILLEGKYYARRRPDPRRKRRF